MTALVKCMSARSENLGSRSEPTTYEKINVIFSLYSLDINSFNPVK
jgi:hypothetical protein